MLTNVVHPVVQFLQKHFHILVLVSQSYKAEKCHIEVSQRFSRLQWRNSWWNSRGDTDFTASNLQHCPHLSFCNFPYCFKLNCSHIIATKYIQMVSLCQTSIKFSCSSRFRHSSDDTLHNAFLLCSSDFIECSTASPKLWKTMKKYKKKKKHFQFWIQGTSIYPLPPTGLSTISNYFVHKSPGFKFTFISGHGTETSVFFKQYFYSKS